MSEKVKVKQYETDYAQRAPSQIERKVYTPGQLHVNSREWELKRDYHVPVGNPNIEAALAANYHHGYFIDFAVPVTSTSVYPAPIVLSEKTYDIKEVGVESVYTAYDMADIDIHKFEKPTGGFFFDSPVEPELV